MSRITYPANIAGASEVAQTEIDFPPVNAGELAA